jgi:queuine tRNA-ribosyltransferase
VNLAYSQAWWEGTRAAIAAGRYAEFQAATEAGWARGDLPPR